MDPESSYQTLYKTIYGNLAKVASGVDLSWRGLTAISRKNGATLISDVTGGVKGGRLLALMGPSGSGKTTFLNQLSQRSKDVVQLGTIAFGGVVLTRAQVASLSGYVLQDDILFEKLTVEEVLSYGARIKMHPAAKAADHARRVTKLLDLMDLTECRHVVVGGPTTKGISGGQRKRLCVALELLSRPAVLFLDEPTTGLDSVTALSLVHTLRGLAHKEQVTIVATLHQPSRRMFDLFDDLLILDHGEVVYQGVAAELDAHFASLGFECAESMNPTEWALTVIADKEQRDKVVAANASQEVLLHKMLGDEVLLDTLVDGVVPQGQTERVSWWTLFRVLAERSFKLQCRDVFLIGVQLVQTVVMAVLVGTVFLLLPNIPSNATIKRSALFFCCVNQGAFGALLTINVFPAERLVIMRERLANWYGASAYVLAKASTELIFQSVYPLLFSCIVYFLMGMQATPGQFFIFLGFMELCMFTANSVALLISVLAGKIVLAAAALPLALEVARLFGGFYMPPISAPLYFSWLSAVSYINYVYQAVTTNEFTGLVFNCNVTGVNATTQLVNGTCPTGDQVLTRLGIDYIPIFGCALVLLGLILVMRVCAFAVLKMRP
jgi:ABC-type multidrug transport system ATPase subunit/ABC-type multidrug transport system permease subunit